MKNAKNIKSILLTALCMVAASGLMSSCTEDIELKVPIDEGKYDKVDHVYGSIINTADARLNAVSELRTTDLSIDFRVDLTKSFDAAIDATMKFEPTLVESYNAEHNTNFAMLPAELVSFEEDGAILIAPGDLKSVPVSITIASSDKLRQGTTYLLPVAAEVQTQGVRLDNLNYVLLVKYMGTIPDCSKSPDVKIISCLEVNDVNPLNNMEFSLQNSGKLLFDIVVLFSANIKYDEKTGSVYLWCNSNILALLNNREKYLKPLQDRGMKVVLGVLGDHTIAGVANLSQPMAVDFAAELKSYCDAYNLDGIYFDDEYANYAPFPGFIFPSSSVAAARLVYETKMAMPDKLCMVFMYNGLSAFHTPVDGVDPGLFVDYATDDYGRAATSVNSFKGITMKQLSPFSQEYVRNNIMGKDNAVVIRERGYGANMIFSLNPERDNFNMYQMSGMRALAEGVFSDKLVWSKKIHPKDYK